MDVDEVLAIDVTGLLSSFTKVYCNAFLATDITLTVPSSHPKQNNPAAGMYYEDMTALSTVN
jgi:hypothetical protein